MLAYQATFDPWFIATVREIAAGMQYYAQDGESSGRGTYGGRVWETADDQWVLFSGSEVFRDEVYLPHHVARAIDPFNPDDYNRRHPMYPVKANAWRLTGDDMYLRRAQHAVDWGTSMVQGGDGVEDYLQGHIRGRPGTGYALFTMYHLRWFPLALRALAEVEARPDPIVSTFKVRTPREDEGSYTGTMSLFLMKEEGEAVPLYWRNWRGNYPSQVADVDSVHDYQVIGPNGEVVLDGSWTWREFGGSARHQLSGGPSAVIPADAPAGQYQLNLSFRGRSEVALPLSAQDTPEVMVLDSGEPLPFIEEGMVWFYVPQGTSAFKLSFPGDSGAIVWDPRGRAAWRQEDHTSASARQHAEIAVPEGLDGMLWRITNPSRALLDPVLPPVIATEPRRWFKPSTD